MINWIWDTMRTAAVWRHGVLHRALREAPSEWVKHEKIIKDFYGY